MTVPTEIKRKEYSGSGSAGPFTITFPILDETHLSVSKVVVATGVTTTLTLNAGSNGYTVNTGLTEITLTEVLASGEKLVILRSIPLKQETDYLANNAFPAETNEQALDYLTMIAQQLDEKIDRAILLPETSSTTGIVIPEPEAGLFLAWNGAGTALENTPGLEGPQGPQGDPGLGDVNGPASSTEKQIALFDGTTGKLLEGATGTGVVKVVSGVYQPPSTIEADDIANNAVTTAKIADNAVTLAKIQNATANSRLLGSGASGSGGDYSEITLGTNLSMSGTTLNATSLLTSSYDSGDQTISSGGGLTLAHGLGTKPKIIQYYLKCLTAQHNYAVGDEVQVFSHEYLATNGVSSFQARIDATNIRVRFAAYPTPFFILDADTGGFGGYVTNANWAFIVRAYA